MGYDAVQTMLIIAVILLIIVTILYAVAHNQANQARQNYAATLAALNQLRESYTTMHAAFNQLRATLQQEAQRQFQAWRDAELDDHKQQLFDIATREANVQLQTWKTQSEISIRQDAIARSQAVAIGKYTEHMAPYMDDFVFDPRDARFIGSPIDLIVFDGITGDGEVKAIVFLEVKTGESNLNPRQRRIRDAVQAGRVAWREMRINKS